MSNAMVENVQLRKRPSVTWSLCWKQAHEFVPAMTVLTVCSLFIYFICGSLDPNNAGDSQVAMNIFTPMTVCFIYVACFIAFVSENDGGTHSFLVNLPLSSWHAGAVKMLMVVLAVGVFFAVQLVLASLWMSIDFESNAALVAKRVEVMEKLPSLLLGIAAVFGVPVLISLFACSFWTSPWVSILTAITLGVYALFAFYWQLNSNEPGQEPLSLVITWLLKGSLLLVASGAIWFPLRWLRRRPWSMGRFPASLVEIPQIDTMKAESSWRSFQLIHLPRGGRFGALIWQSLRQQKCLSMLVFFGGIVLLLYYWAKMYQLRTTADAGVFRSLTSYIPAIGLAGIVTGWMALFRDKRDDNFEFFQQHREHGVSLVIARIVCSIFTLMIIVGFSFLASMLLDQSGSFRRVHSDQWDSMRIDILMSGLAGYAAMLMCSMVFRSHIYAIAVGLIACLGAIGSFESQWSAWLLALPFLWLISSVFYGPAWLAGRRSWRWNVYFAIILLLAFSIPIYTLSHRLIQITTGG